MRDKALQIINKLREHGFQSVFAGGSVRDFLLGIEPSDYDIASDAPPDTVEKLFDKTVSVGKAFGVIVVVIDDIEFEVARYRADGQYSDGRIL